MGACYSQRKIQKELKKDFRKQTRVAKLLLLGAGQSGKSTIVKQIKLIQLDRDDRGFTEEEKYNKEELLAVTAFGARGPGHVDYWRGGLHPGLVGVVVVVVGGGCGWWVWGVGVGDDDDDLEWR